jgi:hypothetical protein
MIDSYMVKSENLSLTLMAPLTLPLSPRGEGRVRGEISNIFG